MLPQNNLLADFVLTGLNHRTAAGWNTLLEREYGYVPDPIMPKLDYPELVSNLSGPVRPTNLEPVAVNRNLNKTDQQLERTESKMDFGMDR